MSKLKIGDKFSVHAHPPLTIAEVLDVVPERNHLRVRLYPIEQGRTTWEEDWNLAHTYTGFKQRVYRPVEPPGRHGLVIDYPDDIDPKLKEHADLRLKSFQAHGSMTGRFSSSEPPKSNTGKTNFTRQASAVPPMQLPLGARPLGDGALGDCYVMDVDYAAIELRLLAWGTQQVKERDQRIVDLLAKVDEILAVLPVPTDERLADHPEWMQQLIPLTAQYVDMQRKLKLDIWDDKLLAEMGQMEAMVKVYLEMQIPPGYNNHYNDGIAAHNRGDLPDKAPFHSLDQKVTLAWLRGWSTARAAQLKHAQADAT